MPHRSLPPCGGGTGRGVQQARRLFPMRRGQKRSSLLSCLGLYGGLVSRSAFYRHPPPCPSPARGEGTVWHAPSPLTQCVCGQRCVHALAPARGRQRKVIASHLRKTAESDCFTSSQAGIQCCNLRSPFWCWVPAFAGMNGELAYFFARRLITDFPVARCLLRTVLPAPFFTARTPVRCAAASAARAQVANSSGSS